MRASFVFSYAEKSIKKIYSENKTLLKRFQCISAYS